MSRRSSEPSAIGSGDGLSVPDGEVGGRRLWISWQYPLLRASPFLVPDPSGAIHRMSRFPILSLAEGVNPDDIDFGELGYARVARASYQDFCIARERGDLLSDVKFQVCLTTPMAVIYAYCCERDVLAVYDAYERDMICEVDTICRARAMISVFDTLKPFMPFSIKKA